MSETFLLKQLVERESELTKKRVVALARQQWTKVLDYESRIDECGLIRRKLVEPHEKQITISPA